MKLLTINEYSKSTKTNEVVGFIAKQVAKAVVKKVIKSKVNDDVKRKTEGENDDDSTKG